MASKERDAIKRKCLAADFLRDLFDNKDAMHTENALRRRAIFWRRKFQIKPTISGYNYHQIWHMQQRSTCVCVPQHQPSVSHNISPLCPTTSALCVLQHQPSVSYNISPLCPTASALCVPQHQPFVSHNISPLCPTTSVICIPATHSLIAFLWCVRW